MLKHLHISSYALIDTLDVDFKAGFTTITGETGAGKSIMLGALSLLLGNRADTRRASATPAKTVVEGIFDTAAYPAIAELLIELDVEPCQQGEMILRREISTSGRSRAFVNDTPVSLSVMSRVASCVIDIHSQHANRLIADPSCQLDMLDSYADNSALRSSYRNLYISYRNLRARIRTIKETRAQARENEEFIAFRLDHLRRLKPVAGEQAALEARRQLLADSSAISENLSEAISLLSGSDSGTLDSLGGALSRLRQVDFSLLNADTDIQARLESARIDIADIASTLEECLDRVEADPSALEKTEARLDRLYEAQRRFKVSSEAELIALQESLEHEYAAISGDDADTDALEQELHLMGVKLKQAAADLTESRRRSAEEITARLTAMARPLGMPHLRLLSTVTAGKLTASGADTPALLVAFNKNQDLRPVQEVASGGENSRLVLCLKALMAQRMALPTIIFDEVDTGVSGDIAHRMGSLMRDMSQSLQVIAITHLPQVAAKGTEQFKVYKTDTDCATHTHMRLLSDAGREEEIAAMLSGDGTTEAARLNARALLEQDS